MEAWGCVGGDDCEGGGMRTLHQILRDRKVKKYDRKQDGEEKLACKLHEWYLEATKALKPESYNPDAQKAYADLTEEQRQIDRYIAKKVLSLEEFQTMRQDLDAFRSLAIVCLIMAFIGYLRMPVRGTLRYRKWERDK